MNGTSSVVSDPPSGTEETPTEAEHDREEGVLMSALADPVRHTCPPVPPVWVPAEPIESDRQLWAALGAHSLNSADRAAELAAALADVPVGGFDRAIGAWLAGWEDGTVATVLSWLYRARAAGAAAERARLAGRLGEMHDRQDAEWLAMPADERPSYAVRSWYLDALREAAQLVERGGADLPVRVDTLQAEWDQRVPRRQDEAIEPPGVCPGHVGRGTGVMCAVCGGTVPHQLRRAAESPSEVRADCADCRRGAAHVHRAGGAR